MSGALSSRRYSRAIAVFVHCESQQPEQRTSRSPQLGVVPTEAGSLSPKLANSQNTVVKTTKHGLTPQIQLGAAKNRRSQNE